VREVLRGDMCVKGVHYNSVFAAAPRLESTRVFLALCVIFGMKQLLFDIKTAYLNADLDEDEQVIVRYPREQREYRLNPETGVQEELYGLLIKALYGHQSAGRKWAAHRDSWAMMKFSSNGWSIRQMIKEPCWFVLLSNEHSDDDPHRVWIICHTDDCRVAADHMTDAVYVSDAFSDEFGIRLVSTGCMLGIDQKEWTDDDGTRFLEINMERFIDDASAEYKHLFRKKPVEIPFPERKFFSLCNEDGTIRDPAGDEANRNHARGYRSLVGVLLWIGRNCKLHCATGLHHLSKVMSAPTDDAFDCAIWMLQYCYETKQHGIRYKSSGDTSLRVYYDASNAKDPRDGKCTGGHVAMLAGAAVTARCKKFAFVASNDSSSVVEFYELNYATQTACGLKELLVDVGNGAEECANRPIPVIGDNSNARRWAIDRPVTPANMPIPNAFWYVNEQVRLDNVVILDIDTKSNPADLFTKNLGREILRLIDWICGYEPIPPVPDFTTP
jgi:hypothetical protein